MTGAGAPGKKVTMWKFRPAMDFMTVGPGAVQCSAVQCSAVQCSTVQCSAVQYSAVQCCAAGHPEIESQRVLIDKSLIMCVRMN